MDWVTWFPFVAASLVLLVMPGPTIILVMNMTIRQGRKAALFAALGVAAGDCIAMTLSLVGLGSLILASTMLFSVVKWIGACYLVFIGISILRTARPIVETTVGKQQLFSMSAVCRKALLVTSLNPKSIAFFLAFVPQFIRVDQPLPPQLAILIATFVVLGFCVALAYGLMTDYLRRCVASPAFSLWASRISGVTLVLLGIALAVYKHTD